MRQILGFPRLVACSSSCCWSGISITVIRLSGPADFRDHDQERPLSYIMDIRVHGNWICQRDYEGRVASKPPLLTWLIALSALPFERVHRALVYLPCALAVGLSALLIFLAGRAAFSRGAGFFAALFFLLSFPGVKQVCLARTDPVFTFLIALTAWLGYRAWRLNRSWMPFWLAAAATTLTKGPLGLVLASIGFLAHVLDRPRTAPVPLRRGAYPGSRALSRDLRGVGRRRLPGLRPGFHRQDDLFRAARPLGGRLQGAFPPGPLLPGTALLHDRLRTLVSPHPLRVSGASSAGPPRLRPSGTRSGSSAAPSSGG